MWTDRARCKDHDPDLWFPEPGDGAYVAKGICGRCPVRGQCLAWAIVHEEQIGIWGGLAMRDRRAIAERWHAGESLEVLVEASVSRAMFSTSFHPRR